MSKQPRPTFDDIKSWLEERRRILQPMMDAQATDELWFEAGTSEKARRAVADLIPGLPKSAKWTTQLIPLAYLGTMVGVNQVHVGETIEVAWHIPETIFDAEGKVISGPGYTEEERKVRERKISHWLTALVRVLDTYGVDSIIRELVIKLIGLGEGAVSYSLAWDRYPEPPFGYQGRGKRKKEREPGPDAEEQRAWEGYLREKARVFPFEVIPIHPTTLYFDPFHSIPYDYIREEKISWARATERLPELANRIPSGTTDAYATRITYASPQWRGQWIENEPITKASPGHRVVDGVTENTSGLPLHRMAFGGFGSNNKDGDYVAKGKGIIRDGRDLIALKIATLNKIHRIEGVTAFPPFIVTGPDPAIRAKIRESVTYGPGESIDIPDNYKIEFFPEMKIAQALFSQDSMADRLLEQHFGPLLQRGAAQPGETAEGQRTRFTIASAIYRSAEQAGQQLVAALLADLLWLVKYELRERCPIMGGDKSVESIVPEDIDDGGWPSVDFTPATEDEKAFQREGVQKDLQAGIITPQEAAEALGYDDPEGHSRDVRVQKVVDVILEAVAQAAGQMEAQKLLGVQAPLPSTNGAVAQIAEQPVQDELPGNPEQRQATENVNAAYGPLPVGRR